MKKKELPLQIRYEYEQSADMHPFYAHGVWGGINPQGEIEMNFYTESDKFPQYAEQHVSADGIPGEETPHYDQNGHSIVRHIGSRLILNYHTARILYEWLDEKLQMLEEEIGESLYPKDDDSHFQ